MYVLPLNITSDNTEKPFMINLPRSISKLDELFESGAPFNLRAAIQSVVKAQNDESSGYYDLKRHTDIKLKELVKDRFANALDTGTESLFLDTILNEFTTRFGFHFDGSDLHYSTYITYIKPVISDHFRRVFIEHLQQKITDDDDIQYVSFVKNFIAEFGELFSLDKNTIHLSDLHPIARSYFPTLDFHSRKARNQRRAMAERRFQRSLRDLNQAKDDGDRVCKNNTKGFQEAGRLGEEAWVKVMKEYFGTHFDIHQNKPIRIDGESLAEYDIVLTLKDHTHTTPAITDYVHAKDVVAAFEVKKTLRRSHVALGNKDAIKIFDTDCMRLKKSVMPKAREFDGELTPYQMLRGKIYFGVLCLDIEDEAIQVLMSGPDKSHPENFEKYYEDSSLMDAWYLDYIPDIIFCPEQLLWAKEISLPLNISLRITRILVQERVNAIDSSVSSFGYLIASMRKFFIGQGHIPRDLRAKYLEEYQYFVFLNSDNRKCRIIRDSTEWSIPQPVSKIGRYLNTRIPNEFSDLELSMREPLKLLKKWTPDEAQDIIGYVKRELKRIVKLECEKKYQPLPKDVNPNDESFDAYINTLFDS